MTDSRDRMWPLVRHFCVSAQPQNTRGGSDNCSGSRAQCALVGMHPTRGTSSLQTWQEQRGPATQHPSCAAASLVTPARSHLPVEWPSRVLVLPDDRPHVRIARRLECRRTNSRESPSSARPSRYEKKKKRYKKKTAIHANTPPDTESACRYYEYQAATVDMSGSISCSRIRLGSTSDSRHAASIRPFMVHGLRSETLHPKPLLSQASYPTSLSGSVAGYIFLLSIDVLCGRISHPAR